MKKKWPYIIGIVLIVVPILFLYVSFNGNPISKWQAKKVGIAYLNDVYEENAAWVQKTNYNFKDGTYVISYSFSDMYSGMVEVGPSLWPQMVVNTYVDSDFIDYEADERISDQAALDVKKVLENDFTVDSVSYAVSIPTTSQVNSLNYDIRQKTPYKPAIAIYLSLSSISSDEVASVARGIRDKLDAAGVYYVDFWVYIESNNQLAHHFHVTKNEIIEYD